MSVLAFWGTNDDILQSFDRTTDFGTALADHGIAALPLDGRDQSAPILSLGDVVEDIADWLGRATVGGSSWPCSAKRRICRSAPCPSGSLSGCDVTEQASSVSLTFSRAPASVLFEWLHRVEDAHEDLTHAWFEDQAERHRVMEHVSVP